MGALLPFFLLSAFDNERNWARNSLLSGLLLVFNFYSDYYHFLAACIFTVIVLAYYLVSGQRKPAALAKRLLPAILFALPLVLPAVFVAF